MSGELRILFFTMANLNVIDGSSIWMHSVAETLHADERTQTTILLRAPEARDVITRGMHRLPRVRLVDPRTRRRPDPSGMTVPVAMETLERLDREAPHDVVLIRAYDVCMEAVNRGAFAGRLWSCYILEPERDLTDPQYIAGMTKIAEASRHVVCQSEEMRALLESVVPAAIGKTILIAPGIPTETATRRPDPGVIVPRLLYAGKFHRFYPVLGMIEMLTELREEHPSLEFHVAGDKFHRPKGDTSYATALGHALSTTPGVVWHGGIGRDDVEAMVAQGGIALSLWDFDHGPGMNNLVISTKLLDYCSLGIPVVLNRTAAQEEVLGVDYPLFVNRLDEALPLVRRVLSDPGLYRDAAERTFEGSRRYTYPQILRRFAPYLDRLAAELLPPSGAPSSVAILGDGAATASAGALLRPVRRLRIEPDGKASRASAHLLEGASAISSQAAGSPARAVVAHLASRADVEALAGSPLPGQAQVVAADSQLAAEAAGAAGRPATVIPQPVDDAQLARPKLPGARFNVLVVGNPEAGPTSELARFAEALGGRDERFRVVRRGGEAGAQGGPVGWEPDDGDTANWLRTIGFAVAVRPDGAGAAELAAAVASGAVPVLIGDAGAAAWLVSVAQAPEAAAEFVLDTTRGGGFDDAAEAAVRAGSAAGIGAVRDAWLRILG